MRTLTMSSVSGIGGRPLGHRRQREGRQDRIEPDAGDAVLARAVEGQGVDPALRRGVGERVEGTRHRIGRGNRRDVDDRPAARLVEHDLHGFARAEEGRAEVQGDRRVPRLQRGRMQRPVAEGAATATGARQQGVEPTEVLGAHGEGPFSVGLVGQIGGDPLELRTRSDAIGQGETVVFAQGDHEQSCTLGREAHRSSFGDASGSGDAHTLPARRPPDWGGVVVMIGRPPWRSPRIVSPTWTAHRFATRGRTRRSARRAATGG